MKVRFYVHSILNWHSAQIRLNHSNCCFVSSLICHMCSETLHAFSQRRKDRKSDRRKRRIKREQWGGRGEERRKGSKNERKRDRENEKYWWRENKLRLYYYYFISDLWISWRMLCSNPTYTAATLISSIDIITFFAINWSIKHSVVANGNDRNKQNAFQHKKNSLVRLNRLKYHRLGICCQPNKNQ